MCLSATLALGCDDDKPYTPFQVASSLPEEPTPPPSRQALEAEEQAKTPAKVLNVGGGSSTAKLFGRELKAPQGTWLDVVLGGLNGEPDLVYGWVIPSERGGSIESAGVWSFDIQGNPLKRIEPLPDFLPNGKDCQFIVSLAASGTHTFTAEAHSHCSTDVLAGTPVHSLAVLDPKKDDAEIIHLRYSAPPPGEKLSFEVNSKDRDGDGIDDVEVIVQLKGPAGLEESLPLRWLVRTAGASREPDAPRAEVDKRASRLLISAVRKAERGKAPGEIDTLRRLLKTLCSELGRPLLTRSSGDKLPCGPLEKTLARLVEAEVKSYLGEGELSRALGAVEREQWYGKKGERSPSLFKLLAEKIPSKEARRLARFRVAPKTSPLPYRTPLHFHDDQLWLVTNETTKRLTMDGDPPLVTPATDDQPEQRIAPPKWSIDITGSDGTKLQAAVPSCERAEVLVALEEPGGQLGAPIPLPILAPRPGKCGGFAPDPLPITPLYWEKGALYFAVAGETLTTRAHAELPSRPVAWTTSLGLAVMMGGKLSLWTGPHTTGLHHCAVDEKNERVACLGKDSISVLTTAAPDSKESN